MARLDDDTQALAVSEIGPVNEKFAWAMLLR
jgi:hypothetical protein